jgi:DNA-directed RNA polymerase subunit RPC12/RpoP
MKYEHITVICDCCGLQQDFFLPQKIEFMYQCARCKKLVSVSFNNEIEQNKKKYEVEYDTTFGTSGK